MKYQAPTAPATIGRVLDDGLRIYRASFSRVWVFALMSGIVSLPVTYAANSLDPDQVTPAALAMFMLVTFIVMILSFNFYAMIIARMSGIVGGTDPGFGGSVRRGLRRAPAYIGGALLYGLMLFLAILVVVIFVAFIGGMLAVTVGTDDSGTAGTIVGIIAVLLGILATGWPAITFYFYNYAAVIDDKGPIAALGYSFRLISGHWWRTAAIVTIALFIIGVAYLVVVVLTGVVALADADELALPGWLSALIDYVVAPAFQVALMPLFYALPLAIYNDLKLRREGGDLAARIAAAE